jgi:hypothetical protein
MKQIISTLSRLLIFAVALFNITFLVLDLQRTGFFTLWYCFFFIANGQLLFAAFDNEIRPEFWIELYSVVLAYQLFVDNFYPEIYSWLPVTSKFPAKYIVQALEIPDELQRRTEHYVTATLCFVVHLLSWIVSAMS